MGARFNRQDVTLGAIPVGMPVPENFIDVIAAAVGLPNDPFDWDVLPSGDVGQVLTANADGSIGWAASASGFANPMTTEGDLLVGGTSGAGTRLGIGSTNQVLTVVSGAPAWAAASGGGGTPGGTSGQIQYDSDGSFGGFTMSGDATLVTSTGVITISAGAVTLAKQANLAASSLQGNPTGSPAAPSAITLGANLNFSGTTLVASNSGGTVTSVSFTGDGTIFTASADTPVTTSGTLTPSSLIAQTKNTFLAGPTTGSNAAPTFRAIGTTDVPNQLTIGNAVSGGGANRVLYEDGSSNLAASTNLTYNGTTVTLTDKSITQYYTGGGYNNLVIANGSAAFLQCYNLYIANAAANHYAAYVNTQGVGVTSGRFSIYTIDSTSTALAVQGVASQTAPLLQFQQLSSTSAARACGIIDATFNTSTDATWSGNLLLYAGDYTSTNAGKRLGVQVQSNGSAALLGLFGATPVVQPTAHADATMTVGTGTAVLAGSTFTGSSGTGSAYTISDIVTALKAIGALAT